MSQRLPDVLVDFILNLIDKLSSAIIILRSYKDRKPSVTYFTMQLGTTLGIIRWVLFKYSNLIRLI